MKIETHITKTYGEPAKAVLRWAFISINTYIKNKKSKKSECTPQETKNKENNLSSKLGKERK